MCSLVQIGEDEPYPAVVESSRTALRLLTRACTTGEVGVVCADGSLACSPMVPRRCCPPCPCWRTSLHAVGPTRQVRSAVVRCSQTVIGPLAAGACPLASADERQRHPRSIAFACRFGAYPVASAIILYGSWRGASCGQQRSGLLSAARGRPSLLSSMSEPTNHHHAIDLIRKSLNGWCNTRLCRRDKTAGRRGHEGVSRRTWPEAKSQTSLSSLPWSFARAGPLIE